MGIYDGKAEGAGMKLPMKTIILVAGIIAIIVIAFLVGTALVNFFSEKKLSLSLAKPEISAGEQTILYVTVANTGAESLRTISVSADAVDAQAISVSASGTNKLAILGAGEKRTFEFIVNPLSGCANCEVLPGNYLINVQVSASGAEYARGAITLKIK